MLRIAIGALGVLLIGLGFSNDDTLSWLTQKVTAPFSSSPQINSSLVPRANDGGVSTIATVESAIAEVRVTAETIADGGGLIEGEEVVQVAAVPIAKALPLPVNDDATPEPQIEIVPAVAAADNAIDAVLEKNASIDDDTLYVLRSKVNLREGPSIDHSVILRLEQGQELMEFKRDGKWVHVGAYGTEGTVGWVHQSLVGIQQ